MIKVKERAYTPPNTPAMSIIRPPRIRHYTPLIWEPTGHIVEDKPEPIAEEVKRGRCVIL